MIDVTSIQREVFAESSFFDSRRQQRHVTHSRICVTEPNNELRQKAADEIFRIFACKRK